MTDLIGAVDLAWMRTEQNRIHPGTAVIERKTLASDGMGGQTETWAAVGTVAARLYPQSLRLGDEYTSGDRLTSLIRWWITAPHGTDVTENDRIQMSSTTYEIEAVNHDEEYKTAVRCSVYVHNQEVRV